MKLLAMLFLVAAIPGLALSVNAQGGGGPGATGFCPSVGSLPGTHPLLPGSDHSCEDHSGDDHSYEQMAMIDLSFADLSGCDFTDTVMPNATLSNARLIAADLTHIDLSSADLPFADLSGANLTTARLANAYFGFADLTGATGLATVFGTPSYNAHTDFSGTGFDPAAAGWSLQPTQPLEVDRDTLSLSAGGSQRMFLDAGTAAAGDFHLVLGSAGGTSPGVFAYGFPIPLNYPDPYLDHSLNVPNSIPLVQSLGLLDAEGLARSIFLLPPGSPPGLAGLVLHHAFVAYDASGITFVSNPTSLTLVP